MPNFSQISFANPQWFWLLLILLPIIAFYIWRLKNRQAALQVSSLNWALGKSITSFRQRLLHIPFVLRMLTIILLITIMARPQTSDSHKEMNIEGIDVVMALDISGSMRAMDLKPDRLEAAKKVAQEFIDGRPNDRIGLVIFSGEAFTQCPLTVDHKVIKNLIKPVKSGMIKDGTALGDGLATAINRIKDSKAISKVVILVTDGVQTAGSMDPVMASDIAKTMGVRVYTIGVGKHGMAPIPVQTPFGEQITNYPVEIDEDVLQKVAQNTGGKYFRATNNSGLSEIFKEIDQMEKSKIEVSVFKNKYDQYRYLLVLVGILLFIELFLRQIVLRTKP